MRLLAAITVPLLAGCDLLFGLDHVGALPVDADLAVIDADLGVLVDAAPCVLPAQTFGRFGAGGAGLFSLCITPSIGGVYPLDGVVDTDSDTRCLMIEQDTIGTKVCVIASEDIEINANLGTRGESPLVILGFKTIKVNASIDAAARTGTVGAGSNWIGCGSPANGPNQLNGGGGGAGGSFGTAGGNGGTNGAGNYAMAKPATQPDRIRGGCSGGQGGSDANQLRTPYGSGGGAVYLIAGTSIELTATARINASGAGGSGGGLAVVGGGGATGGAGGGGAGAGGLIGLDAPQLIVHAEARLFANGGGGGGGGGEADGGPGNDPAAGSITTQAPGGTGSVYGGAGGAGGANSLAGNLGAPSKAGGGGGGGVGVIKVYTPSPPVQPTNVSPPWQAN